MRRIFSLLPIVLYTGAVFLAGMLVANLYALYVLVYTGAVFMIGIYIGERLEQNLSAPMAITPTGESESDLAEVHEPNELTVKQG